MIKLLVVLCMFVFALMVSTLTPLARGRPLGELAFLKGKVEKVLNLLRSIHALVFCKPIAWTAGVINLRRPSGGRGSIGGGGDGGVGAERAACLA